MALMSRRHFQDLAALVADVDRNGRAISSVTLAHRLADYLATTNEHFDRERFLDAALPVNREEA